MPPPDSTPSSSSNAGRELALRLLASETPNGSGDAGRIDAAERICAHASDGLSRWFGLYGSRALVTRALARAQADHPSLGAVTFAGEPSPHLIGVPDGARAHGVDATMDGIVEMLAVLFDLIGRLIGEDLATSLLEQRYRPSPGAENAHQTVKEP
jgi:hypothetical protein